MAVDFKSHVLRRDEKGLFGIPFKRLLGAGVGGGLAYTVLQMVLPAYAIPFGVVLAFCIIILTAQRGGIALWERLLFRIRGRLLINTSYQPHCTSRRSTGFTIRFGAIGWRISLCTTSCPSRH